MSFQSNGAYIGAIYPFKLPEKWVKFRKTSDSNIKFEFEERSDLTKIRRGLFEPDPSKKSLEMAKIYFELKRICIGNKKYYENIPISIYLFTYHDSFATFVYWIDLSKEILTYNEIIELGSLLKNIKLRFEEPNIVFDFGGKTVEMESLQSVCEYFEDYIYMKCNEVKQNNLKSFSHPAIYLNIIENCTNSDEIKSKYSLEMIGIKNLYKNFEMKMFDTKQLATFADIEDFHPFNYGVSLPSSSLSLELHALNIKSAADNYNLSLERMHFEERFDWIFQIEQSVIEYYILRYCNNILSTVPNKLPSLVSLIKDLRLIIRLLKQLITLTNLYRNVYVYLDEFKRIYLVRRQYTNEAKRLYEREFSIPELNLLVSNKLNAIQTEINVSYNMLTTLFILVVSVIGSIFAFFQAWAAISVLNLFGN